MECLSVLVQKKQWKTSFSNTILLRLGIFLVLYVAYLGVGAVIFCALESSDEHTKAINLSKVRQSIIAKNAGMAKDLDNFEKTLKLAYGITNDFIFNETYESNWSIGKSVFFVGTLLTTIGYGHVTPQTDYGKIFTIVYATIGIPMTLILLSILVERLLFIVMNLLLWLDTKLFQYYGHLLIRLIHLGIVLFAMVSMFLFLPALIIFYLEPQWSLLDSFYYCFTSLTTIGLGDLIPGDSINQPHRDLYKIAVTLYLYAGTTLMMLTMAIIYDIPEIKISSLFLNAQDTSNTTERKKDLDLERLPSRSKMDRDKVMERARLSRTTLGLGLRYGLDWETVSITSNPQEKDPLVFPIKSSPVNE